MEVCFYFNECKTYKCKTKCCKTPYTCGTELYCNELLEKQQVPLSFLIFCCICLCLMCCLLQLMMERQRQQRRQAMFERIHMEIQLDRLGREDERR